MTFIADSLVHKLLLVEYRHHRSADLGLKLKQMERHTWTPSPFDRDLVLAVFQLNRLLLNLVDIVVQHCLSW